MKNIEIEIQNYTFLNSFEIEYQIGKDYFIMVAEEEILEKVFSDYDSEKYDTPKNFLQTYEDIEKLANWFHNEWEFKDHIEPMDLQFSKLYKPRKKAHKDGEMEKAIPATIEMTNPVYIQGIVERMERMEREILKLKEENKRKDDILLTTKMIEMNYQISAKTINEARVHKRIIGRKINGKQWAYEKREVDRYLENSKNYFKNPPQQYAS